MARIDYRRLGKKIQLYGVLVSLSVNVSAIVEKAKENASWSSTIPGAISISSVQTTEQGASIKIIVDLNVAPEAAAFEYGSGLHKTIGTPEKYKIEPKEADKLVFPLTRWPNYQPPPNVSLAVFPGPISKKPYVMHPGVAARPYLKPAIDAEIENLRQALGEAFKEDLLRDIPAIEYIKAEE